MMYLSIQSVMSAMFVPPIRMARPVSDAGDGLFPPQLQRRRVDAITLSGGRRAVGEDPGRMGTTPFL